MSPHRVCVFCRKPLSDRRALNAPVRLPDGSVSRAHGACAWGNRHGVKLCPSCGSITDRGLCHYCHKAWCPVCLREMTRDNAGAWHCPEYHETAGTLVNREVGHG